jgi:hypothetical protein
MQRASVSKMCKNVWKTELSLCSKKPNYIQKNELTLFIDR